MQEKSRDHTVCTVVHHTCEYVAEIYLTHIYAYACSDGVTVASCRCRCCTHVLYTTDHSVDGTPGTIFARPICTFPHNDVNIATVAG